MQSVYFGGSRSLPSSSIIGGVVGAVLASGAGLRVGCSAGADALVIGAVRPSSFSQVRVFACFAPSGAGSWAGSAVSVVQSFAKAGGAVTWLAGGALAVPLRVRLIRRSLAGLAGCSSAVFFAPGSGSLAVAGHAVTQGVPVYVFGAPSGVPAGCAGSWVASSFFGLPCVKWQAAQLSFF